MNCLLTHTKTKTSENSQPTHKIYNKKPRSSCNPHNTMTYIYKIALSNNPLKAIQTSQLASKTKLN